MTEPISLQLGSRPLSLSDLRRVYANPASVRIAENAMRAVRDSHAATSRLAAGDLPAYGINTGFGLLAQTRIPVSQRALLQRNIILSHSAGVGPLLDDSIVRLVLVLKLETALEQPCERARRSHATHEDVCCFFRTSSLARWHELGLEPEHHDESELGF